MTSWRRERSNRSEWANWSTSSRQSEKRMTSARRLMRWASMPRSAARVVGPDGEALTRVLDQDVEVAWLAARRGKGAQPAAHDRQAGGVVLPQHQAGQAQAGRAAVIDISTPCSCRNAIEPLASTTIMA